MKIESINNTKVKNWVKLKDKKYREETNTFIIEGDHLINEALKTGYIKEIIAIAPEYEIEGLPFYEVTKEIMKKITSQVSISPIIAVCTKIPPKTITGRVCVLDNIQDPGNLGTIIRSAVAFNIKTLILSPDTVDLYNDKVIRASEGMIFNLNIIKSDLSKIIPELKTKGYKIYGTNVNKGSSPKDISFSEKSVIIIGNEGKGMNSNLEPFCSELLNIPISDKCESLNAGIAASIIFYELNR